MDQFARARLLLRQSEDLLRLHNDVWAAITPLVAPDCRFTPREPSGERFRPHLTLAQSDLPSVPGVRGQVQALCRYLYDTLPTRTFQVRDMQLIEFQSDDWTGSWWETLPFRQLHGWQLA